MILRKGSLIRQSNETDVSAEVVLNGVAAVQVDTGIGFFDHMLTLFGMHGGFDLRVECEGDLDIDGHHTVEDVGIVLGGALKQAMGDRTGIRRYGTVFLPMDESLTMVSIDISGRPFVHFEAPQLSPMVGTFDTQLVEEFFRAFSVHSGITIHIKVMHGRNTHHILEGIFKAFGRALKEAVTIDQSITGIPSTKGILD